MHLHVAKHVPSPNAVAHHATITHSPRQVAMTFKNQQVLVNCSWEVKKGERVGLVGEGVALSPVRITQEIQLSWPPIVPCYFLSYQGVNGAGKTTQLQIIMGKLQADSGEVVKAKKNMRIAYLAQVRPQGHLIFSFRGQQLPWECDMIFLICLQEFDVVPTRTVREEFYSVSGPSGSVLCLNMKGIDKAGVVRATCCEGVVRATCYIISIRHPPPSGV